MKGPDMEGPKDSEMVIVRDAYKRYKTKSPHMSILNMFSNESGHIVFTGLNLTVNRGTVYALLGPSGCGKTTLLNCLVGRRYIDAGKIDVGVQSLSDIGYMPQDLGLQTELTIKETIHIYGKLSGLSEQYISERKEEMYDILAIPSENLRLDQLSGGQQRRVSLLVALLHDPELLILDEPTVGLDTQLRSRIWNYIIDLTEKKKKTVIITTHYIEEARNAHTVGLMRKGIILEEGSPEELMAKYDCNSMDILFTRLSENQTNREWKKPEDYPNESMKIVSPLAVQKCFSWVRCRSHVLRDFYWVKRNTLGKFTIYLLPLVQCFLFNCSFGGPPTDIDIGFIDKELMFDRGNCHTWSNVSCSSDVRGRPFSCFYMDNLEKQRLRMVMFEDEEKALKALTKNNIWAVVYVPKNLTTNLLERLEFGQVIPEEILDKSFFEVQLDMTTRVVSALIKQDLYSVLDTTISEYLQLCGWPSGVAGIPIDIREPIYGSFQSTFKDFSTPAPLILNVYFFPIIFIIGIFVQEKNSGVWERNMASGMTPLEIILSHFIVGVFNLIIQESSCMLLMYWVFGNTMIGSLFLLFLLLFGVGINGLTFGYLVSIYADTEFTAAYIAAGFFFPYAVICGLIWPLESAHKVLQFFTVFLPLTMPTEATRSISLRGWGITKPPVYYGFIANISWIIIHVILTIILYKRRLS